MKSDILEILEVYEEESVTDIIDSNTVCRKALINWVFCVLCSVFCVHICVVMPRAAVTHCQFPAQTWEKCSSGGPKAGTALHSTDVLRE